MDRLIAGHAHIVIISALKRRLADDLRVDADEWKCASRGSCRRGAILLGIAIRSPDTARSEREDAAANIYFAC
ncbi:hypothetical protein VQ042_06215 [Aurantimonas sp. A2-1-M11]|uniref:hypothetical protein n=1 Tax=Aurantimonas sp. A2-1-M11 TaxID=3113712 RepID=UPI002F93CF5C